MAMQIQQKSHFPGFRELADIFFDVGGFMHIFVTVSSVPSSIEVIAEQVGSVVSGNDSIRVDHRDDLDIIIFPEVFTFLILCQKIVDEALANE